MPPADEHRDDSAMPDDTDRRETAVVTVFLRHDAAVLLLRRSDAAGSYSGRWSAVAGHAEGDTDVAARAELREETGLDPETDAALVRQGEPFDAADADLGTRWVVYPFLFDCERRDVEPNEATADCEWVPPTEILRRETVPGLWTAYDRVRPTVASVAGDREHGSAALSIRALEVLRDEAALAVERGAGERGAGEHAATAGDTAERDDGGWQALADTARRLRDARPSMSVVANRVNRAMAAASNGEAPGAPDAERTPRAVEAAASEGIDRALAADERAALRAAERLPDRVATLSRSGTVFAAVAEADPEAVLVAESRPGREGVGVAERFASETDAAVTLTTDAALADRMAAAGVGALVVGADAIRPDGCIVNKAGTRGAAAAAAHEGIDVYVVAATDKVAIRGDVDREERDPAEVYDGDADVRVANPTFDVTPASLVDAVITDAGIFDSADLRETADWLAEVADWA